MAADDMKSAQFKLRAHRVAALARHARDRIVARR
jgi:hypothetical protein